jgi:hypothetical protein
VICLLSKNWLNSRECEVEFRYAENLHKAILSPRLEPVPIEPLRFRLTHRFTPSPYFRRFRANYLPSARASGLADLPHADSVAAVDLAAAQHTRVHPDIDLVVPGGGPEDPGILGQIPLSQGRTPVVAVAAPGNSGSSNGIDHGQKKGWDKPSSPHYVPPPPPPPGGGNPGENPGGGTGGPGARVVVVMPEMTIHKAAIAATVVASSLLLGTPAVAMPVPALAVPPMASTTVRRKAWDKPSSPHFVPPPPPPGGGSGGTGPGT